ncbi:hypothetical protein Spb1_21110 [Planctopirus ephydatiae]|uniref:Uncharacterized protein n=1 Tax=Planctopirus ephydatiae TaxID=2528019 RepID=A0A518GNG8_9PLAN|nr:hypothetical protein [Planctopirus ephydatiae]QDV30183.1 hypothetical protein Spb1_21110 [Planctopirus ephydatiae]
MSSLPIHPYDLAPSGDLAASTAADKQEVNHAHDSVCSPGCPVCGGQLIEIRHKLICSQCHAICETCCEGGRG